MASKQNRRWKTGISQASLKRSLDVTNALIRFAAKIHSLGSKVICDFVGSAFNKLILK
jgi:hypothetical protein